MFDWPLQNMQYHKREQTEYKSLASSGCLYYVEDAEAKVEVFERNPEAWQHPQERSPPQEKIERV